MALNQPHWRHACNLVHPVSVHANDLDQSVAFYEQLFGMRRIASPTFAFPVQWLRLRRQQLHLFVRSNVQLDGARIPRLDGGIVAAA